VDDYTVAQKLEAEMSWRVSEKKHTMEEMTRAGEAADYAEKIIPTT
jgi:hypothetical protein